MSDQADDYVGANRPPVSQFRLRTLLIGVGVTLAVCISAVLAVGVERAREAAARASCNLGAINIAIHNYHDHHGELPPAVVYGGDGQPLYSWRVLILPFFDERELYDEFRLDEPWDSEHNVRLLKRMPKSFEAPWRRHVDVPPGHTVCRVMIGPGAAFEDGSRLTLTDDFPDGTANTLLFVEAGEPVPWTKPAEIAYDAERPVKLKGLFRDGYRACSVDGTYRFVRYDADQKSVHAVITRDGGESLPAGW